MNARTLSGLPSAGRRDLSRLRPPYLNEQRRGRPEGSFALRAQPNFLNAIKLMLSVQSYPKKYSRFRHPQISTTNTASHPSRGALAIVTNVGMGCGGRGSVGRERDRRAKSFGLRERAGAQDERRCSPASQKFRRGCTIRQSIGEDGSRTAKPCGPGTRCWCQVGGGFRAQPGSCKTVNPPMTVTRRIRRRGEHGISRKAIAQGMPDCLR